MSISTDTDNGWSVCASKWAISCLTPQSYTVKSLDWSDPTKSPLSSLTFTSRRTIFTSTLMAGGELVCAAKGSASMPARTQSRPGPKMAGRRPAPPLPVNDLYFWDLQPCGAGLRPASEFRPVAPFVRSLWSRLCNVSEPRPKEAVGQVISRQALSVIRAPSPRYRPIRRPPRLLRPTKYSFFHTGTVRFKRLMPSRAASNAGLRCGAVTTTATLVSPISMRPRRCTMAMRPIENPSAISRPSLAMVLTAMDS